MVIYTHLCFSILFIATVSYIILVKVQIGPVSTITGFVVMIWSPPWRKKKKIIETDVIVRDGRQAIFWKLSTEFLDLAIFLYYL